MRHFFTDLRFGARLLRRSPGFCIMAVVALGLGIGANSAIFSVLDTLLLRPLPYPDSERVVMVFEDAAFAGYPRNTPAPANWDDWRKQSKSFEDIAATTGRSVALTGAGQPERVTGRSATASLWKVLGVTPQIGRVFTEAEEGPESRLIILSDRLWKRRFGADRKIVGREIQVDDRNFEVIGVMPEGFGFPSRQTEVWTPFSLSPERRADRDSHFLNCIGRLKPGVTMAQAQSEMNVIGRQLAAQYPQTNRNLGVELVGIREQLLGRNAQTAIFALTVASGFLLLIACANVANLLLARSAGREREIAVRSALGASGGRILMQMLAESLLLAGLAAIAGLAMARAGIEILEKLIPKEFLTSDLHLDWRVLLFTVAVSIITAVMFGLLPALDLRKHDVRAGLNQGGRGGVSGTRGLVRNTLVVAEVTMAFVMLTGAGLLFRTLYNMRSTDLGMRSENLLTMSTQLPHPRYSDPARRELFYNAVIDKVRALPGVKGVAYTSNIPTTAGGNSSGFRIEGEPEPGHGVVQDALVRVASADFLPMIGATLLEGRFASETDTFDAPRTIVINETFAKRHWPGRSSLGARVRCPRADGQPWRTVVGVVKDVQERGLEAERKPAIYYPLAQAGDVWNAPNDLMVRTAGDPHGIARAVQLAIWSVDKDQPIRFLRTMDEVIEEDILGPRKPQAWLIGAFAGLALTLGVIGIYSVLSYLVTQRVREIGVRVALGAAPGQIVGMILRQGMSVALAGLAIGFAASLALTRLLRSILHGVEPHDPATFGAVAGVLALAAFVACYVPALRAARVDPAVALRSD